MASEIEVQNLAKDAVFNDDDFIMVFGKSGTRKIRKADLIDELAASSSSTAPIGYHRIPRREGPKNLGAKPSTAQKNAIKNRTYTDMYIGDYWLIDNKKRIIADVDYFHNTGDKKTDDGGDLLMVNEDLDLTADGKSTVYMNDSAITEGGFAASKLYTIIIPNNIVPSISSAFGDNIYIHREFISNATDDGIPTNGIWADVVYMPFTESMLFGSTINAITNGGAGEFNEGLGKTQVALFKYFPEYLNKGANYWLRETVSDKAFAAVSDDGLPYWADASSPYFGVWGYYVLH